MSNKSNILLAFYGDDLTGSTDALEFISAAGAKAILFLEPPGQEQLDLFPGLQVYGIAGLTRSLPPEEMEAVLLPAFKRMKASGAKHVHYKICSTFDSSPQTGSIGKAIDCGAVVFENKFIPVLGGMPALGRYCVFGNLFARMGIGSGGKIYRLDRHPSMSTHPVTPAFESDLRLHLSAQTTKTIGLIDVNQLDRPVHEWEIHNDDEVVLLDALTERHLERVGEWLEGIREEKGKGKEKGEGEGEGEGKGEEKGKEKEKEKGEDSLFSVGSSGIEMALGRCWRSRGVLGAVQSWRAQREAGPLLVLSGSCSPVSRKQISYAISRGFKELPLEWKPGGNGAVVDMKKLLDFLKKKQSVIVHTGNIEGIQQGLSASILGTALGKIGKAVCEEIGLQRIAVAGGDTSSYAGRAMEIDALEMIFPFVSGAPVCRAYSKNKYVDGIEINFKGGQVGAEDYFVQLGKTN